MKFDAPARELYPTVVRGLALAATFCLISPLGAEEEKTFRESLSAGEATVSLRYRYENVDQDAFDKDAHASTLRTLLGYRTAPFRGFSLYLEGENVTVLGNEKTFRNLGAGSLGNGVTDRPVVADPEITEVNQAYLRYKNGETELTAGRQEIALRDQRFVGPVGWRQNHQSFDAFRITTQALTNTTLTYAFIDNTNRIFGDNKAMASHLLDATVKLPFGKLSLYDYRLDYDNLADAVLSTNTYGVELVGKQEAGSISWLYELEFARQRDTGDNPNNVDAGYLHAAFGAAFPKVTARLGFEVLEGSPEDGRFTTPLATLHKFNGWADLFLNTPGTGLEDLYLQVSGKAGKVGWMAVYHDFGAESSSADYGKELDLQLTYKTAWAQQLGLKAAVYDSDGFATDTRKIWFWTAYTF